MDQCNVLDGHSEFPLGSNIYENFFFCIMGSLVAGSQYPGVPLYISSVFGVRKQESFYIGPQSLHRTSSGTTG